MMKLGNDIFNKFNDIEQKINSMIEYSHKFKTQNHKLKVRIKELEAQVGTNTLTNKNDIEDMAFFQSKIDMFIERLDSFSMLVS